MQWEKWNSDPTTNGGCNKPSGYHKDKLDQDVAVKISYKVLKTDRWKELMIPDECPGIVANVLICFKRFGACETGTRAQVGSCIIESHWKIQITDQYTLPYTAQSLNWKESNIRNWMVRSLWHYGVPRMGWASPIEYVPWNEGNLYRLEYHRKLNVVKIKDWRLTYRLDQYVDFTKKGTKVLALNIERRYWQISISYGVEMPEAVTFLYRLHDFPIE